ncbi:hypothetical protein OWC43_07335 [Methylorubrum sp. POS3]
MGNDKKSVGSAKKPELTDADKALLGGEPDWERTGQAAKRLLRPKADEQEVEKSGAEKQNCFIARSGLSRAKTNVLGFYHTHLS